jgi:hypothetical protein
MENKNKNIIKKQAKRLYKHQKASKKDSKKGTIKLLSTSKENKKSIFK